MLYKNFGKACRLKNTIHIHEVFTPKQQSLLLSLKLLTIALRYLEALFVCAANKRAVPFVSVIE